jgi:uncharacterized protein YhaN
VEDRTVNTAVMAHSDLDDRIAAAFADDAASRDIAVLIKETERTVASSGEAAERARQHALDPLLSAEEVAAARRQMEDAAFQRERLQAAVTRLRERLEQVKGQEEDQRRWVAYNKAKAKRDQLAAELADIYPAFAHRLAELLPRIAASDREIEYINNHARPSGAQRLLVAELVARGLEGFVNNSIQTPRIIEELRLPAFEYSPHERYVWPRSV